jgi:CRP-like cAMP-binding protein
MNQAWHTTDARAPGLQKKLIANEHDFQRLVTELVADRGQRARYALGLILSEYADAYDRSHVMEFVRSLDPYKRRSERWRDYHTDVFRQHHTDRNEIYEYYPHLVEEVLNNLNDMVSRDRVLRRVLRLSRARAQLLAQAEANAKPVLRDVYGQEPAPSSVRAAVWADMALLRN